MIELLIIAQLAIGRPPATEKEVAQCRVLHEHLLATGAVKDEDPAKGVRMKPPSGELINCGPPWFGNGEPQIPKIQSKT